MSSSPGSSADAARGAPSRSVSALRSASVIPFVRGQAAVIAVWTGLFAWATALFVIVRSHYVDFRLARFDLGNMVQAVSSTAHGHPLEITTGTTGEQMIRLGVHVDPILAALAPLWIAAPTPLTLAAAQIVALALGALPVFWLARRHLGSERTAVLLAVAYLACPWIAWAALDAFHPLTLAIPLFLFCVWFLDTGRPVAFTICAVLVLMTGELMGLPLAALGIWYASSHRRRAGLAITALGIGWTVTALYVVVPAFSGGSSVFYGVYDQVGGSPWGLIQTACTDPGTILSAVTERKDVLYVLLLSAPLAGAFVLAPGLAAVAVPQLGVNLAGGLGPVTDPRAHYIAGIIPFLFAAVAIGLGRLSAAGRARGAVLVFTLSLAISAILGPWPGALGGAPVWYHPDTSPDSVAALQRAVALVPDDAPVSSTNNVGSHLSSRRYFYSVPLVGRAEWIVLDSSDAWIPQAVGGFPVPAALGAFRERIERDPHWQKVFEEDGVLVFRRAQT